MTGPSRETNELFHHVAGSIEVARHMIERSVGLYRRTDEADLQIVTALFDAADALRLAADALGPELRPRELVGPAA